MIPAIKPVGEVSFPEISAYKAKLNFVSSKEGEYKMIGDVSSRVGG